MMDIIFEVIYVLSDSPPPILIKYLLYFFSSIFFIFLFNSGLKLKITSFFFFYFQLFYSWRAIGYCTDFNPYMNGNMMIALYYQTKTPINFWYRRNLILRSLIQPSEILLVELTGIHFFIYKLIQ